MSPSAESDDRSDFSRFREDPNPSTVNPSRLMMGHFFPLGPRFRRLPYIPDTPPHNLAFAPRMRPSAESGCRLDFLRFREDPNRPAANPTRLILGGHSPRSGLVFADFRTFRTHRPVISRQECDTRPHPTIDFASRDFAKILTDRPSSRVARFWSISPQSGLIFVDFLLFGRAAP